MATLLKHDLAFRQLFMEQIDCVPPLEPALDWIIRVEDVRTGFRRFDVTLETASTFVLLENKIAPSARRDGQLLEYYDAVAEKWPASRVVALYLAPDASWGRQDVDDVKAAIGDRGYVSADGPDWAQAVSWESVRDKVVPNLPAPASWFATSGVAAIDAAITAAAARVDRDWSVDDFLEAVAVQGPHATLVAQRAVDWFRARGLNADFGRGATGPMYLTLPQANGAPPVRVVKVYTPEASINISYRKLAGAPPFNEVARRVELIHRLNSIPGTAPIRDEYATESESSYISNEVLANPVALDAFFGVMDWLADELLKGGGPQYRRRAEPGPRATGACRHRS